MSDDHDSLTVYAHTGLVYIGTEWHQARLVAHPDRQVVADKRERAICKALLRHALDLIEEAEDNDE